MNDPQDLNWAMSELSANLVTLKDMSPEQAKQARQEAEYWATAGLARHDRCKCGERYSVLSPECPNKVEHEVVVGRLEVEKEAEELVCQT